LEAFEGRDGDGDQPDVRPRLHVAVERHHVGAEDLVADGLVEQAVLRDADGALLEGSALGLEQQRLAEALGGDDDELLAALRREKGLDARRLMKLAGAEIVGDLNVVRIHGPGAHAPRAYDSRVPTSTSPGATTVPPHEPARCLAPGPRSSRPWARRQPGSDR